MMTRVRAFFTERALIEVDCPAACNYPPIDLHIDLIKADTHYLFTSPEYGMKRLLVMGMPDIYQLCHVYRKGEVTQRHNPEFMLAEWYRLTLNYEQFLQECCDFIHLFIEKRPVERISYQEAFLRYVGLNPHTASDKELKEACRDLNLSEHSTWDRDDYLNLLLSTRVEPRFDKQAITILTSFPKSQAMLARTREENGITVAARFEFFTDGLELGNGYHELTDQTEQKRRLHAADSARKNIGKEGLTPDPFFLAALEKGLPNCFGVAMGFDRLMMVRHNTPQIGDVIPFAWNLA